MLTLRADPSTVLRALLASVWALLGCVELPAELPPFPDAPDAAALADGGDPPPDASPVAVDLSSPDAAPDGPPPAPEELCNGLDDDGDGEVDERTWGLAPETRPEDDPSRCRPLVMRCIGGVPDRVADRYEEVEGSCDGLDNDCDGTIDEGHAPGCTWCDGRAQAPPCNGCPDRTIVPPGYVCVPPGDFVMGSPPGQPGRAEDEGPAHRVELTAPLLVARDELSQALWSSAGNAGRDNPAWFSATGGGGPCDDGPGLDCPVERVSWYDALAYTVQRSQLEGLSPCYVLDRCEGTAFAGCDGDTPDCEGDFVCPHLEPLADCGGYRLPTEAEWERFARAGSDLRYWRGDGTLDLAETDIIGANSDGRPRPFDDGRPSNGFGLRDVHGNVEEWTYDGYAPYPIDGRARVDPTSHDNDSRVARGGSWDADADACRSAHRQPALPADRSARRGLRLVRTPTEAPFEVQRAGGDSGNGR